MDESSRGVDDSFPGSLGLSRPPGLSGGSDSIRTGTVELELDRDTRFFSIAQAGSDRLRLHFQLLVFAITFVGQPVDKSSALGFCDR